MTQPTSGQQQRERIQRRSELWARHPWDTQWPSAEAPRSLPCHKPLVRAHLERNGGDHGGRVRTPRCPHPRAARPRGLARSTDPATASTREPRAGPQRASETKHRAAPAGGPPARTWGSRDGRGGDARRQRSIVLSAAAQRGDPSYSDETGARSPARPVPLYSRNSQRRDRNKQPFISSRGAAA